MERVIDASEAMPPVHTISHINMLWEAAVLSKLLGVLICKPLCGRMPFLSKVRNLQLISC